jgi:hypothetical protein
MANMMGADPSCRYLSFVAICRCRECSYGFSTNNDSAYDSPSTSFLALRAVSRETPYLSFSCFSSIVPSSSFVMTLASMSESILATRAFRFLGGRPRLRFPGGADGPIGDRGAGTSLGRSIRFPSAPLDVMRSHNTDAMSAVNNSISLIFRGLQSQVEPSTSSGTECGPVSHRASGRECTQSNS